MTSFVTQSITCVSDAAPYLCKAGDDAEAIDVMREIEGLIRRFEINCAKAGPARIPE